MRSPVGISGLQAGKDAGKKQRRTVINLGRRDLLVDPPGTRLAIEATHFRPNGSPVLLSIILLG